MPIFVQWKWVEKTKTFLVVFHFFDDFSKPNIRFRKKKFTGNGKSLEYLYVPPDYPTPSECPYVLECPASCKDMEELPTQIRTVMTWAPSHPELGLLSELLSYANIVNGLKEIEKRKIRKHLEITMEMEEKAGKIKHHMARKNKEQALKAYENAIMHWSDYLQHFQEFRGKLSGRVILTGSEISKNGEETNVFCVELCPEYLDYLKTVLKKYLK